MSKYTKKDLEIIEKFQKVMAKHGWKPMKTSNVGGAWFGGRSHSALADYIPSKKAENFEEIILMIYLTKLLVRLKNGLKKRLSITNLFWKMRI
jgi:hypothetical protein